MSMQFSDFGFKENPFSITPDPRYLFLSRGHEESLAHLIYGTGPNGGFVLLTGEVGTGKTLLLRSLLEQRLEQVDIALILNPRLSRREFIAAICDELGVEYQGPPYQLKQLVDNLVHHLLRAHAKGHHTVVVVDEAQNLSPRVLEQVRLLTNLETARHKLLRIILVGQPELQQMLARKELRQVDQRITARYHLNPLDRRETAAYVRHRLAVAGVSPELFSRSALWLIHRLSGGIPRRINTLCERVLLAIFTRNAKRAGPRMVWRAWREVRGSRPLGYRWPVALGLLLLSLLGLAAWLVPVATRQTAPTLEEPETQATLESPRRAPALPPPETVEAVTARTATAESTSPVERAPAPSPAVATQSPTPSAVPSRPSPQAAPSTSQLLAQHLFGLWGKTFDPHSPDSLCVQALKQGLRCLRGKTDWPGLRRMNRPALLTLQGKPGERHLLLTEVRGDRLQLVDARGERQDTRDHIAPRWRGDFLLLWRPVAGVALVGPGSIGKPVTWLRQRLALAGGNEPPMVVGLDHFDSGLRAQLRQFQKAHGLGADGVAGQYTLLYLNNLQPLPDTPLLRKGE